MAIISRLTPKSRRSHAILGARRENDDPDRLRLHPYHAAIPMFRISSETIPFGSHPANQVAWWEILAPELGALGELIHAYGMRVSMHPGQNTVLNSVREEVVGASIAELVYHARLLDALGVDTSHKIILHVGGTFGDKSSSMQRFVRNFGHMEGYRWDAEAALF